MIRLFGVFVFVAVLAACASETGTATRDGAGVGAFGGFIRSLNDASHGYAVIRDPTGQAPVSTVERFEVRAGDCGAIQGWDDCATDRERSELSSHRGVRFTGGEYWYGWWMYLPSDFPDISPVKTALGQFHQIDSHPIWMLQHQPGGLYLDRQTSRGTVELRQLLRDDELRGRWHRLEMHVLWSRQSDGFLRMWVNGAKKVDYSGPTFYATQVYFKYGVYRSFLSRSKVSPVPTQVALFAGVRAGRTREDLRPGD